MSVSFDQAVLEGLDASKPAASAGTIGRLYFATDTGKVYRDNGSAWVERANDLQLGTTATTATAGNDSRLSDARTPTAHATTHQSGGSDAFTGIVPASAFAPAGLTGATAASRYVGATASGAPASGTFAVGDFVIDQGGKAWICTTAGSPGTWTQLAGGGGNALTVEEVDGSPTDSAVTKIVFPNGTLSIASHIATYTPAASGGGDFVTVDQVNLAADATSVRFPASGSLPTGYGAWRLTIHGRGTDAFADAGLVLQYNADTGSNYDWARTFGGATTGNTYSAAQTSMQCGVLPGGTAAAGRAGLVDLLIGNPADTTFYKSFASVSTELSDVSASGLLWRHGGLWRSTSAITSLLVTANLKAGTILTLAGQKAYASPRTS